MVWELSVEEKYAKVRFSSNLHCVEKSKNLKTNNLDFLNNLSLEEHYNFYSKQGFSKNEIIKRIAKDRNVNKNEIYMKFI